MGLAVLPFWVICNHYSFETSKKTNLFIYIEAQTHECPRKTQTNEIP